MRREHRLRHWGSGPRRLCKCLDKRREIGSGIGEQVFDPALGEQSQIGFRHVINRELLASHWHLVKAAFTCNSALCTMNGQILVVRRNCTRR